ncbi:Pectinesterase [Bertholletia excelsa]
MGYDRLGKTEPGSSQPEPIPNQPDEAMSKISDSKRQRKLMFILVIAVGLIVSAAVTVAVLFALQTQSQSNSIMNKKPTKAISRICSRTRYETLCINSLVDFPGAMTADDEELVHISVNVTLQRYGRALSAAAEINNFAMDDHVRSAYEDCLELLEDSVDQLSRSLAAVRPLAADGEAPPEASAEDVMTWLSASMTNHDTCSDGLQEVDGDVKDQMGNRLKDLSEIVSNSLAIYAVSPGGYEDLAGIQIQNRRRRLMGSVEKTPAAGFPEWLSPRDRKLLDMPASAIQADIVVAKDGSGTCTTIAEAIKKAPEHGTRRTIIYVRAGEYQESDLKVGRKKTKLMFIGDGIGKTVITGKKSVADKVTTFHTASFAATGDGFIARDITFKNLAGPQKHQAVALRVGADHAVVYRCSISGYQDALYVHSQRQFFRECQISGTVDFIFGNAAVVFQKCIMIARKPLPNQKITITAQGRKDPNQNTGISIHDCNLQASPELEGAKGQFPTYLGRPWKLYSRTVYLKSYMGDHIDPRGWLEWNDDYALETLYYGEYMNYGPGAGAGRRVRWPGYHLIKSTAEASRFTVAKFIDGSSWLPSTGVAFLGGL